MLSIKLFFLLFVFLFLVVLCIKESLDFVGGSLYERFLYYFNIIDGGGFVYMGIDEIDYILASLLHVLYEFVFAFKIPVDYVFVELHQGNELSAALDDKGFVHSVDVVYHAFYFFGIDILAGRSDYHGAEPAEYVSPAFAIDFCEVSGVQPAVVGKYAPCALVVFVVSEHDIRTFCHEFAISLLADVIQLYLYSETRLSRRSPLSFLSDLRSR